MRARARCRYASSLLLLLLLSPCAPQSASPAPSSSVSRSAAASRSAQPSALPAALEAPSGPLFCAQPGGAALGAFSATFLYAAAFQSFALPAAPLSPADYTLYAQLWGGGGSSGSAWTPVAVAGGGGAYVAGVLRPALLANTSSLVLSVGAGGQYAVQTAGWGGVNWPASTYTTCAGSGAGASALGGAPGGIPWVVAGAGGTGGQGTSGAPARWEGTYASNGATRGSLSCTAPNGIGGGGAVGSTGGAAGCGNGNSGQPGKHMMNLSASGIVTGGASAACGGCGGGGFGGGGGGGWCVPRFNLPFSSAAWRTTLYPTPTQLSHAPHTHAPSARAPPRSFSPGGWGAGQGRL